jgi:hypothetical protein
MIILSVVGFVGHIFELCNYCYRLNCRIFDVWYMVMFMNLEIHFLFCMVCFAT